jgi:hypothetical protein
MSIICGTKPRIRWFKPLALVEEINPWAETVENTVPWILGKYGPVSKDDGLQILLTVR